MRFRQEMHPRRLSFAPRSPPETRPRPSQYQCPRPITRHRRPQAPGAGPCPLTRHTPRPNRAITQPAHLRNHTPKKSPPHPDSPQKLSRHRPTPHHAPPPWSLLRATPKSPEPATEPSGTAATAAPHPRTTPPSIITTYAPRTPPNNARDASQPLRATPALLNHRSTS